MRVFGIIYFLQEFENDMSLFPFGSDDESGWLVCRQGKCIFIAMNVLHEINQKLWR